MDRAAGKPPDEPRVDRTEEKLAALARFARAGTFSRSIAILVPREVGVDHETGLRANQFRETAAFRPLADRRGEATLPDDGVVQWAYRSRSQTMVVSR